MKLILLTISAYLLSCCSFTAKQKSTSDFEQDALMENIDDTGKHSVGVYMFEAYKANQRGNYDSAKYYIEQERIELLKLGITKYYLRHVVRTIRFSLINSDYELAHKYINFLGEYTEIGNDDKAILLITQGKHSEAYDMLINEPANMTTQPGLLKVFSAIMIGEIDGISELINNESQFDGHEIHEDLYHYVLATYYFELGEKESGCEQLGIANRLSFLYDGLIRERC